MNPECTLCFDGKNVHLWDSPLNLYQCSVCDHTFTIKLKEALEVYEEKYYLEKHSNWFANPNYPFFKQLHGKITQYKKAPRLKLLDVGYGNGDFLKYLAKNDNSLELHGIDSMKVEHEDVNFIQGDFFQDVIPHEFDAIVTLMVIEHVEHPKLFVQKLNEYLVPDGILIISTNNNGGMLYSLARSFKKLGWRLVFDRLYSDHHLQHFTNRSLRLDLEKNGFEILELKNHNYPLKAVDTPAAPFLVKQLYLVAVYLIFRLSELCGNAFLQTYVCRKKREV